MRAKGSRAGGWRGAAAVAAAVGAVVIPLLLSWALGANGVRSETTDPVVLRLPPPTGPAEIGSVELHLVDRARADPWVPDSPRELMVSVWYPAAEAGDSPLAAYLRPGTADSFEHGGLADVDVRPSQVDLAAVLTHARAGAPADVSQGPRPVVLYSPGGGTTRSLGSVLVEELASHGYVVVTVDHTYEAGEVEFPDGRVEIRRPMRGRAELLRKVIEARVGDLRFVLDQLDVLGAGGNPDAGQRPLPEGLAGVLDPSRVGAFGHSAGGFTTAETMLLDRRIDAGANLDGSLGYDLPDDLGDVARQGLDRPFLLMGAGTSGSDGRPHTPEHAPDWRSFWERSTGWKLSLHVPEGEHFTFTDSQALLPQLDAVLDLPDEAVAQAIGVVDPDQVLASQRAYLRAFFDQHLWGRPQAILDGPSADHPDVAFVRPQG